MDSRRFDALTKQLYALTTRREGLRVLIAGLGAGAIGLAIPGGAAACKSRGSPCKKSEQCCSGGCEDKKKVKKRSGEFKKDKVGKCACSFRGGRCKERSDCCGTAPCVDGRCGLDCSATGESCLDSLDCCSDEDVCAFTTCDDGKFCCGGPGSPCDDDCDCCGTTTCIDLVCGGPQ